MGLRINLNIASLLAQRNLGMISKRLDKAYAELSSGTRINRAGDDAAGLAISQILTTQSRSVQQAIRNAADGRSVIDTAEAAMATIQDSVQRIRELAVQAANDVNSLENRVSIQAEIDELTEEISRIAESTAFNRHNLLDGTFVNQRIQVGVDAADYLPITIQSVGAETLGQQAIVTGSNPVSILPITGTGDLIINGVPVPASVSDGQSFVYPDASAIAKANAINKIASLTGVTAEVEPAVFQNAGSVVTSVTLNGTDLSLFINGHNIGEVIVEDGDSTGALVAAINAIAGTTGVRATIAQTGELTFESVNGENFQLTATDGVAEELGLIDGPGDFTAQVITGKIKLRSSESIEVVGTNLDLIGFTSLQSLTNPSLNSAVANISVTTQESAEDAIASADAALETLNRMRAMLGSLSNRLEGAMDSLSLRNENLIASNSRIRDTDFADATARATQEQILQEAATAILAQANLLPQQALQLLQR